jgi:dolichyl-phosphate-mannose--protein O-mannosyl transferase
MNRDVVIDIFAACKRPSYTDGRKTLRCNDGHYSKFSHTRIDWNTVFDLHHDLIHLLRWGLGA